MATTLTGTMAASMSGSFSNPDAGGGAAGQSISITSSLALTNGTGNNMADRHYGLTSTVGTGGTSFDLAASLVDTFGSTITFVSIVGILIKNSSSTTGENIIVGNGTNPFLTWCGAGTHTVTVKPGGVFALFAPLDPYAVTASTGDVLKIAAATGTITYSIEIFGRSA